MLLVTHEDGKHFALKCISKKSIAKPRQVTMVQVFIALFSNKDRLCYSWPSESTLSSWNTIVLSRTNTIFTFWLNTSKEEICSMSCAPLVFSPPNRQDSILPVSCWLWRICTLKDCCIGIWSPKISWLEETAIWNWSTWAQPKDCSKIKTELSLL